MNILKGIKYNLQGLWLGVKTPKLLLLGFIRFAVVIFITRIPSGDPESNLGQAGKPVDHLVVARPFLAAFPDISRSGSSAFLPCISDSLQCAHHGLHVPDYRTHGDRTGE